MGKGKAAEATGLIVALAKQEAASKRPSKSDDYRTCAKGILAAIQSGSEEDLAKALQALQDVSREAPGDG